MLKLKIVFAKSKTKIIKIISNNLNFLFKKNIFFLVLNIRGEKLIYHCQESSFIMHFDSE